MSLDLMAGCQDGLKSDVATLESEIQRMRSTRGSLMQEDKEEVLTEVSTSNAMTV